MKTNSYQEIKNFIFKKLQEVSGTLPPNEISDEIKATQDVISQIGLEMFARILSSGKLTPLSDLDWKNMHEELEKHFNVEMKQGVSIQGKEQQQRDCSWWTSVQKQKGENYYWNRYKEFIRKSFSPEVVKTIDVDTDIIMNNIADPSIDSFDLRGMVVGHVQSGKTANYSALVCKAADAGYKFIVVIAGGTTNLRNQTQKRLNESFVGKDRGDQVGAGIGNTQGYRLPVSLTTAERDFNKQDADRNAQSSNFDNIRTPVLIVIQKNTNSLNNVISWLEKQYKNQIAKHAMLLIDDESDYASPNTKDKENPTAINEKIRKLLILFCKSAYVAYTATPFANIFIDHEAKNDDVGPDLFPQDFIYVLDTPTNYFSAQKIFLNPDSNHVICIDDYLDDIPASHRKDFELPSIPPSLYEAIRLFLLNVAIRQLRSQGNKHNSMLIHATRFTMVHQRLSIHVEDYLSEVKKDIGAYGELPESSMYSKIIRDIKATLELRHSDIELQWDMILSSLCSIIDTILIREVHQDTSVPLEYRDDRATNVIVIGGTSLSRGFTLEGLSVSYFLRNTVYYDTLMQMGRWFGYRPEYEDLCKIYIPLSIRRKFAFIIETIKELLDDFKTMSDANMTPHDFGLAVKQHPDNTQQVAARKLQVTARNKQKNVKELVLNVKLDGRSKETSWLPANAEDRKKNLHAISNIITTLSSNEENQEIGSTFLWKNIDRALIKKFLTEFKTYQTDPFGISARMPIGIIKKYVEEQDTKWDVALYSGEGKKYKFPEKISIKKERRQLEPAKGKYFEIKNRQVSKGNAESIVLSEEKRKKWGSKRKAIRQEMVNPLLMLHILQTEKDKNLAAFGVTFPGSVLSQGETVSLRINTVYYKNLLEELEQELEYESEADD